MLIADAIASPDSSMAPSRDSSASRLWGGTRPTRCCRRRASSIDWTMGLPTLPDHAVDRRRDTAPFFRGRAGDRRPQSNIHSIVAHHLFGHNLHVQPNLDIGMQPQWHLVGAQGPDRLVQVETPAVDLDAGLGLHRGGDVSRGYRAEQA